MLIYLKTKIKTYKKQTKININDFNDFFKNYIYFFYYRFF